MTIIVIIIVVIIVVIIIHVYTIYCVYLNYLISLIFYCTTLLLSLLQHYYCPPVKAVAYPGDPEVVVSLFRKQEWGNFRKNVLDEIPKDRWLMNEEKNGKEPFRIH